MILNLCNALIASTSILGSVAPASLEQTGFPSASAQDVVFVAPMGILIPVKHNGLAYMIDAPHTAIKLFQPEADLGFDGLAELSETVTIHDVGFASTGGLRSVTLDLPGFPLIEGEIFVEYFNILPDGTVEFSTARTETGCRLIIQTEPITGGLTVRCAVTDCTGPCDLIVAVQPDGTAKFSCACLKSPPQ